MTRKYAVRIHKTVITEFIKHVDAESEDEARDEAREQCQASESTNIDKGVVDIDYSAEDVFLIRGVL